MKDLIHPDYNPKDMLLDEVTQQPLSMATLIGVMARDMEDEQCSELKQWLGTLLVNGKRTQVQLVLTSTDYVDED
ncbi:hypothetical protein [Glaciecola sp. 1036]|uniref:hypothetical protein n=1 Tax=Alteromonadaceae TaxID=72275 RepID=UPI003D014C9C